MVLHSLLIVLLLTLLIDAFWPVVLQVRVTGEEALKPLFGQLLSPQQLCSAPRKLRSRHFSATPADHSPPNPQYTHDLLRDILVSYCVLVVRAPQEPEMQVLQLVRRQNPLCSAVDPCHTCDLWSVGPTQRTLTL